MGVERTRDPGQRAADGEGHDLCKAHLYAEQGGDVFVVMNRAHGQPEPCRQQIEDENNRPDGEYGQQAELGVGRHFISRRAADHVHVDDDAGHDFRKRKSRQHHIDSPGPEYGKRDDETNRRGK